jgi:hypothetical protein
VNSTNTSKLLGYQLVHKSGKIIKILPKAVLERVDKYSEVRNLGMYYFYSDKKLEIRDEFPEKKVMFDLIDKTYARLLNVCLNFYNNYSRLISRPEFHLNKPLVRLVNDLYRSQKEQVSLKKHEMEKALAEYNKRESRLSWDIVVSMMK